MRSATRSQLGRSRPCPASGHNVDVGPEKRAHRTGNLRNSKRAIVSFVSWGDPVRASVREPKKSVVYIAPAAKNLGTSCTHRQSNHRAMRRDHRTTNDHEHPGSPPLGPRGGRGSCRESARQRADRACQADGSGSESTPTSPLDCERFCRAEDSPFLRH